MLHSPSEWLDPRVDLKFQNLEFARLTYTDGSTEPTGCQMLKSKGSYRKISSFDYGNGYYNLPRGGVMDDWYKDASVAGSTRYVRHTVVNRQMEKAGTEGKRTYIAPYRNIRRSFVSINPRTKTYVDFDNHLNGANTFRDKCRTDGELRSAILGSIGMPEKNFTAKMSTLPNFGDDGYVPFQSDKRIQPAIFKAETIHNGQDNNKVVPYYLEFTVHLKYKVFVYDMNTRNVAIVHDVEKGVVAQDAVIQQHFRNNPVFAQGDYYSPFKKGEKIYFNNGHWRVYTPVTEYHFSETDITVDLM